LDEKNAGFIHNSLHYATATVQINPSTPLHDIALANREAVNQALKPDDIEAGMEALREVSRRRQAMVICEPRQKWYAASNWCGAWRGIDFSKTAIEPRENTELVVLGLTKLPKYFGRCESFGTSGLTALMVW
jgi:hypothetical protein